MTGLSAAGAKVDITPPLGTTMDGFVDRPQVSVGIHDRLHCRALVLRTGEVTAAVVSTDLCWLGSGTVSEVQKRASAAGVDKVFLAATHTHSGPAVADFIVGPTTLGTEYVLSLPDLIAEAIETALRQVRPVTAEVSAGDAALSVNRRLSSLPVDPKVISLTLRDSQGNDVAGVLNYSCHPTVLGPANRQISADYPGMTAGLIEESIGGGFVSIFLNGACGDVNPSTCDGYLCEGTFSDASTMARGLVAASRGSSGPKPVDCSGILHGTSRIGPLPPWGLSFELTAMDLGGVAFLGVPGELFASTGLWLREKLSPRPLIVSGLTNGYVGYFPTQDAFERKDYETKKICWVDASAEAAIRREAIALLDRVRGR